MAYSLSLDATEHMMRDVLAEEIKPFLRDITRSITLSLNMLRDLHRSTRFSNRLSSSSSSTPQQLLKDTEDLIRDWVSVTSNCEDESTEKCYDTPPTAPARLPLPDFLKRQYDSCLRANIQISNVSGAQAESDAAVNDDSTANESTSESCTLTSTIQAESTTDSCTLYSTSDSIELTNRELERTHKKSPNPEKNLDGNREGTTSDIEHDELFEPIMWRRPKKNKPVNFDGQMKRMSISLFLKSPLATAPTINKIDNVFERENTSQHNQINVVKETESLPNASSPPATTEKDGNKDQHSNTETPNTTGDSSRACRLSTRKQTLARREAAMKRGKDVVPPPSSKGNNGTEPASRRTNIKRKTITILSPVEENSPVAKKYKMSSVQRDISSQDIPLHLPDENSVASNGIMKESVGAGNPRISTKKKQASSTTNEQSQSLADRITPVTQNQNPKTAKRRITMACFGTVNTTENRTRSNLRRSTRVRKPVDRPYDIVFLNNRIPGIELARLSPETKKKLIEKHLAKTSKLATCVNNNRRTIAAFPSLDQTEGKDLRRRTTMRLPAEQSNLQKTSLALPFLEKAKSNNLKRRTTMCVQANQSNLQTTGLDTTDFTPTQALRKKKKLYNEEDWAVSLTPEMFQQENI